MKRNLRITSIVLIAMALVAMAAAGISLGPGIFGVKGHPQGSDPDHPGDA